MNTIAMDSANHEQEAKPLPSVPKIRYTPYTLKLYRQLRRIVFPGRKLERMAEGARKALERCEQIGQCKIDT
jgi:hypothetical protein